MTTRVAAGIRGASSRVRSLEAIGLALACGLLACSEVRPATPLPERRPAPPPASSAAPQAFADTELVYGFTDPDRKRKLSSAYPRIDAIVEAWMKAKRIPSIVVGIVVDGELAHTSSFGVADVESNARVDADTLYGIASVGKTFTALAAIALRDEGALSLDDALVKWVPEASALVYPTRDSPPITLRHLLTHTSGLPRSGTFDATSGPSEAVILESLSKTPLTQAPGTQFSYSNLGYKLLGIAIGRVAKSSLRDLVTTRILKPLGMSSTGWDAATAPWARRAVGFELDADRALRALEPRRLGAGEGDGALYSTVRDMARYAGFQLAAYPPRSNEDTGPVRRSSLRESHFGGVPANAWNNFTGAGLEVRIAQAPARGEPTIEVVSERYGLGWGALQTCDFDQLVWHSGAAGGYSSVVELLPEHGVAVVALANLVAGFPSEEILDALRKSGGLAKRVLTSEPTPAFKTAMEKLLAVYNQWDDAAYAAMLTNRDELGKASELAVQEKEELAGYKRLHGSCKSFRPAESVSAGTWRFDLQCERGRFSMEITLDKKDGRIWGFVGTSRDVEAPPELQKAAERLMALATKWDERAYERLVRTNAHADPKGALEGVRYTHGACTTKSARHEGVVWKVRLACERGGPIDLVLSLDPKDPNFVARFSVESAGPKCPVR